MKTIKLLSFFCLLIIFTNSCSGLNDASKVLRNEKIKTTDEFLIKKKNPLSQPPDFDSIPVPGSTTNKADKAKNSIEKIINKNQNKSSKKITKSSSIEESILNQIKK